MERLFIGGSADGQFKECPNNQLVVIVCGDNKEELYVLLGIEGKKHSHEFMVLQGLSVNDAIRMLAEHYGQKTGVKNAKT